MTSPNGKQYLHLRIAIAGVNQRERVYICTRQHHCCSLWCSVATRRRTAAPGPGLRHGLTRFFPVVMVKASPLLP